MRTSDRSKIEHWINEAPEFRKIETETLANDAWDSRAIEDGQVVFEEVEVDVEQPILRRLAAWCEQHTKLPIKPLAKAAAAHEHLPLRRSGNW